MAIRKSSSSGIPFGLTAGRPANPSYGQLYSNGETARLELYTQASGWQNIVQETPGVSAIYGHYYESDNSGTFTISGTNFVSGAIAYAVGTNAVQYEATTTTYNSLVQLTAVFQNLSPAYEPYDIKVVNPSNLFGLLPDALYINDSPVWSTASGSLGTVLGGSVVSKTVSATDADSSLTYSISSGSLPTGLSLNSSTGAITGTVDAITADTTYTFTVTASDGLNASISRSFNIPVTAVSIITGGTVTSDSTYYYRTFTANGNFTLSGKNLDTDILVIAGGGSGGVQVGGGGGAGGLSAFTRTLSSGTYSCTIGAGGSSPGTTSNYSGPGGNIGNNGSNSTITKTSFTTISTTGGGGGGGHSSGAGQNGGSGGGSTGATPNAYGSGIDGQGYRGGSGYSGNWAGGGGGGAGGIGGNAGADTGGNGGIGATSSFINSIGSAASVGVLYSGNYYFAGGGGGCNSNNGSGRIGYGGTGGGANGTNDSQSGSAGLTNTGGGGGGSRDTFPATAGGSGIIVFKYTKASVGG